MDGRPTDVAGLRLLVVGALRHRPRGRGQRRGHGAKVAVAARRMDLLTELAESIGGTAFELDVEDASAINRSGAAAEALGGLDARVSPARCALRHIEDTDVRRGCMRSRSTRSAPTTCCGPQSPICPRTASFDRSSHDVGRPRAGVSAYSASKAALDEILHSWRSEHPELSIVRVGIGPTADTEILRGADRDLLSLLFRSWVEHGQLPAQMSALSDVANMLVSLVISAYTNPSVVPEIVQLSPRIRTTPPGRRVHGHRRR